MATTIEHEWQTVTGEVTFRCGSCTNTIRVTAGNGAETGTCGNCGAEYAVVAEFHTMTSVRRESEEPAVEAGVEVGGEPDPSDEPPADPSTEVAPQS